MSTNNEDVFLVTPLCLSNDIIRDLRHRNNFHRGSLWAGRDTSKQCEAFVPEQQYNGDKRGVGSVQDGSPC